MKKIISVCFLICLFYEAPAQVTFQKTYSDAIVNKSLSLKDGSLLITGISTGGLYVAKTDSLSVPIWAKHYGLFNGTGQAYYITVDSLSNIVISGVYGDSITNLGKAFLMKLDSTGGFIWCKVYYDSLDNISQSHFNLTDGYILQVHKIISAPDQLFEQHLIKTDLNGNLIWSKSYFDTTNTTLNIVSEDSTGRLLILGSTTYYDNIYKGIKCLLDSNGNLIEVKVLADTIPGYFNRINGRIKLGSSYYYYGQTTFVQLPIVSIGMMIIKTDSSDNILWSKVYGTNGDMYPVTFTQIDANEIIIGSRSPVSSLVKIDSSGNVLWSKGYYISPFNINFTDAYLRNDSGFILVGSAGTYPNVYVVKTDKIGNAGCLTNSNAVNSISINRTFQNKTMLAKPAIFLSNNLTSNTVNFTFTDSIYCIANTTFNELHSYKKVVEAFPNPFRTDLNIVCNIDFNHEIHQIKVLNLLGETVYIGILNHNASLLHLSFLPAGVYILSLNTAQGNSIIKLIKN